MRRRWGLGSTHTCRVASAACVCCWCVPQTYLTNFGQQAVKIQQTHQPIIDLRENVMDFPNQPIITRDNVQIEVCDAVRRGGGGSAPNCAAAARRCTPCCCTSWWTRCEWPTRCGVLGPRLSHMPLTRAPPTRAPAGACEQTYDLAHAVEKLVQTTLRSIIGDMGLDDTLASREEIERLLSNKIKCARRRSCAAAALAARTDSCGCAAGMCAGTGACASWAWTCWRSRP